MRLDRRSSVYILSKWMQCQKPTIIVCAHLLHHEPLDKYQQKCAFSLRLLLLLFIQQLDIYTHTHTRFTPRNIFYNYEVCNACFHIKYAIFFVLFSYTSLSLTT